MNTINKINTDFLSETINVVDVANFRLFLRREIYPSLVTYIKETIVHNLNSIQNTRVDVLDKMCFDTVISLNVSRFDSTDMISKIIIKSIMDTLNCYSDTILSAINYSEYLSDKTRAKFKKILYTLREKQYYSLVDISIITPTICISL